MESELSALRERRMSELEARAEMKESELNELRSRMMRLREDFQYNLKLIEGRGTIATTESEHVQSSGASGSEVVETLNQHTSYAAAALVYWRLCLEHSVAQVVNGSLMMAGAAGGNGGPGQDAGSTGREGCSRDGCS